MSILLVPMGGASSVAQSEAAPDQGPKVKVIIKYKTKPGKVDKASLRKQNKAKIRFAYDNINAIAATVPRGQLKAIRARKKVKGIEIDHPLMLFDHGAATGDPELEQSWGVEHIGGGRAHANGHLGNPVRAAVIDTGIYCAHADIGPNCAGGVSYIPGVTWDDDHGHGTHVSGILAGARNGTGIVGMAPQVELIGMKVLDSSGAGDYSGLIAALDQIATWNLDGNPGNDVDVVNMSLGGSEASATLQAAVVAAANTGTVLVAASGNVNPLDIWQLIYGCPVVYPAAYPQVLATTFTNGNDALAGYSCTGPEVDFSAPGDLIVSSVPPTGPLSSSSGYLAASGTSMASPHLAGTVALLLSYGIADTNGNGRRDEIEAHLCATADVGFGVLTTPIPPTDPRYPEYFGCGVIDAGAALVDSPPGGGPPPTDDPPQVEAGPDVGGAEGEAVALAGSVIDEASPTIAWSADPDACTFGDPADPTTTVSCADDGAYTLTLSADDGVNAVVTDTTTLTLTNAVPAVEAGPDQSVSDGDRVDLAATFTDAGSADTHTATVDWGEGAGPAAVSPGAGTVTASHTYAGPGTYTVTVAVTDDDGDTGSDSLSVTVDAVETTLLTFSANADAHVDSRRTDRNYGSSKRLKVRDGRFRTLVRFAVDGVDGTVQSATLRLYLTDPGGVGTAYAITEPWTEGGVTWGNQPSTAGGPYVASNPSASSGTWVEWDVTAAVSSDGPRSFIITDGSSDNARYHSREARNDPELVIEFIPGVGAGSHSLDPTPPSEGETDGTATKRDTKPKDRPRGGPGAEAGVDVPPGVEPEGTPSPEVAPKGSQRPSPKDKEAPGRAGQDEKPQDKKPQDKKPLDKKPPKVRPAPEEEGGKRNEKPDGSGSSPDPNDERMPGRDARTIYDLEPNPLKIERLVLVKGKQAKPSLTAVLSDDGRHEWVIKPKRKGEKTDGTRRDADVAVSSRSKGTLTVTLTWPDGDEELTFAFVDEEVTFIYRRDTYTGSIAR